MVTMLPASTVRKPAPAAKRTSRTGKGVSRRRAPMRRIMRQREVGLGDAHGKASVAGLHEAGQRARRRGLPLHIGRTVERRRDLAYLFDGIVVELVEAHNRAGRGRVARIDYRLRQLGGADAALPERVVRGHRHRTRGERFFAQRCELGRRIGREAVDRHDHRRAELAQVRDVRAQVGRADAQRVDVFAVERRAGHMALERPRGHDAHRRVGGETGRRALEVKELLGAELGGKAGLGHEIVDARQRDEIGHDRRVAVRNVRERAGVHEDRITFGGSASDWAATRAATTPPSRRRRVTTTP